ncbi:hypothetical protein M2396_000014 [Pseudomonas sp. BIGb0278]|uniref:hypothetical protein n=1 Tax=Pseudomonas sp. BIGb0278 TaxID=2940607 RepID=UPI002169D3C4|nr:hypothetical protein [Pseudomonas sp. BIGb0278]MCS4281749.1 hypothetical protein [Pseudomonas sp. BIGb0278]
MKILGYRYLPANMYMAYSVFVLLSLYIGPIEYIGMDSILLLAFLGPVLLLFYLGFILGARGSLPESANAFQQRRHSFRQIKKLMVMMLFSGAVSAILQWYFFLTTGGGLSFNSIGESYVAGYEGYERGRASVDAAYVLNILQQSLTLLLLLFGFYYYSSLGRISKATFIFVVLTYLLVNVLGAGKQKYLGDLVIFTFFGLAVNFAASRRRFKISTVILSVAAGVLIFALFVEILRQRYQAAGINIDNIYDKTHALIVWNRDASLFELVNTDYALALGIFLGYFTNGLNGLYLSLTLPFEWSYFVGNSYSLGRIIEIIFSADGAVLHHTYPYRVGEVYGWGFDKWHSMFAWLASDITFPGVVMFAPLFAFVYARVWIQAIRSSNPFAGALFIYLSMGLVFSYSNNQLMHSLSGVLVLFFLLVGWLIFPNRNFSTDPTIERGEP